MNEPPYRPDRMFGIVMVSLSVMAILGGVMWIYWWLVRS
jgi:hypothetical protein